MILINPSNQAVNNRGGLLSSLLPLPLPLLSRVGRPTCCYQVVETGAYVVLLVCVCVCATACVHACVLEVLFPSQCLCLHGRGEGHLSDSWVSWCELCCAPAVPFGQQRTTLQHPPPPTPTPLTPIRQPLQVLPAKIRSDPVSSLLIR